MSYDSPVIRFDNADSEQINNPSAEHSAFSQLNSARSFARREPQRSSSLPSSHIQTSFWRGRGEPWLVGRRGMMNVPDEERRRRSTGGHNINRGKNIDCRTQNYDELFMIYCLLWRYEYCQGFSGGDHASYEDSHKYDKNSQISIWKPWLRWDEFVPESLRWISTLLPQLLQN